MIPDHKSDRARVVRAVRELLIGDSFVVLDTEVTCLEEPEIVQLAIIDSRGRELFYGMLRPTQPDNLLRERDGISASSINGITPDMLADKPTLAEVWGDVLPILSGRDVVAYNVRFDARVLAGEIERYDLPPVEPPGVWHCAMEWFAVFVGQWNSRFRSYKWHKLPVEDEQAHDALGDVRSTLALLWRMAGNCKEG